MDQITMSTVMADELSRHDASGTLDSSSMRSSDELSMQLQKAEIVHAFQRHEVINRTVCIVQSEITIWLIAAGHESILMSGPLPKSS